jgi:dihydrofolate reductase
VIISIIVAIDERGAIGKSGGLPWRLSSDLKRFRELTMGHHVILGRKTFETIGKPLPGREIIVVTRQEDYKVEGCALAHSVDKAIGLARAEGEGEVFIGGGAEVYAQAMSRADRMYLTVVHAVVEADTFFPEWDQRNWVEQESFHHPADEKNQYPHTFKLLNRKKS